MIKTYEDIIGEKYVRSECHISTFSDQDKKIASKSHDEQLFMLQAQSF